ncbi:MAG: EAL domain-containing protein, partial [Betaproteobacteria bacterium]|nr:EAL domain-containing protein [Betaproteobacteria bacterium]
GVRGLFIASDSVTRSEFKDYIDSLDLNRRYPGIQVIHYGQRVAAAHRRAFEAMVRNDTSVDPRGYPDLTVKPPGDRPEYVIVQYVEPMAGNEAALGLDLAGEAVRLAALERTRDSGRITASGAIALALEPHKHPGFAMRVPVYRKGMPFATVAQRREAFIGTVSTSFVVIDLMRGVLNEQFLQKIQVRIHDAGFPDNPDGLQPPTAENLMFDSNRLLKAPAPQDTPGDAALAGPVSTSGLDVGGRHWNIYFSARQGLVAPSDRRLQWAAFLAGITISLLLFGLIRSLAISGSRAVELANRITGDLRESQKQRDELESRFELTFDCAAIGIVHTSLDRWILLANRKFLDMTGYSLEELQRMPAAEISHPDDVAANAHMEQQLLENKINTFLSEKRYVSKHGRVIWAKRTTSVARSADGTPRYYIHVIEDVTETKLNEERYRAMFENAAVGITRVDLNGVLVDVNQKFCDMLGHARDELIGKAIKDITHPDDYGQGAAFRGRVTRGEMGSAIGEKRFMRKDGAIIWARRTMSVVRDDAGNPQYVISVVEDITERKQAAKALDESESRYRSVIAAIAEGVILRDKNARIVACNASAERILGRSLDQMRGNVYFDPDWQAIRDDGSAFPNDERPANAALRTGQPQPGVVIGLRREDGTVLWLTMSAQPLFEESDTAPSGVVTTITDITQRKQAELRQAMEHGVTRLLSEAEALEEVMPKILQTICETLGFACGALWLWDEHQQAGVRAGTWSVPSAEVMEFVALGRWSEHPQRTTGGLIRRARTSGEPVWITDVTRDASFRRGPLAAKAGLHGAFAFPVRFGNDILGVMEFFSRASRPPDEVLVQSTRSIGSQIGQFMARRQAEERVRHLAHYDELTGLPNRSMFNQRLSHALAQARRHEKPLAILFIDLDRFKNINDTLGHEAGDRVLKDVADRLRGCLRESDTVGRLGGDEFVVLIEGLPQTVDVAAVAQKILTAVAEPFILDSQEFHITASIGISTYPDDSEDMQTLLKNADISMYRAKEQGKNNYQFYSAQINVHSLERLALESGLRRALERNEFLLHYQPRLDIGSGRITGVEALVRWQQPAKELVPPAQFIPLAEETGLIVPIGEWVLKTACARSKSWQGKGLPPLRIAVNLSARQFAHENLLQDVARVLNETGLDPTALEFEITESMVMHNPEHAVKLLNSLKAMGIHLSIDDFGTGYSSLNYLKRFPIDSVKIDRSFIQDLPGDSDDAAITRAIIAMAHSLRLKVVAEGVETEEQLGFLRDYDCDEVQGYYFSRPLPEAELVHLLRNNLAPSEVRSSR